MHLYEPWVLVVDDEEDECELLGELLEKRGIPTRCLYSGTDAVSYLEELPRHDLPAAIITDLMMPGMLGMSLLDYLQSEPVLARVPVTIVTAHPELAPDGYLVFTKPLRVDAILQFLQPRVHKRTRSLVM